VERKQEAAAISPYVTAKRLNNQAIVNICRISQHSQLGIRRALPARAFRRL
jgi:hypothetical protein